MTLDDVVKALAGARAQPRGKAKQARRARALRRKIYAQLRPGGPLIQNGMVSVDASGHYLISDKGRRFAQGEIVDWAAAAVAQPQPEDAAVQSPTAVGAVSNTDVPGTAGTAAAAIATEDVVLGTVAAAGGCVLATEDAATDTGAVAIVADSHQLQAVSNAPPLRQGDGSALKSGLKHALIGSLIAAVTVACILVYREIDTSVIQSRYFTEVAAKLTYVLGDGPSDAIIFPENAGPFDLRLGYSLLPGIVKRTTQHGYRITAQARLSPLHLKLVERGLIYPIYHEKPQAGLTILDADGKPLFNSQYPKLIYDNFDAIPDVVVRTLLFIENRNLLDPHYPYKNPTLDWSRLSHAIMDALISKIFPDHDVPGGSTLATQIEKYRHSPEGRTASAKAKLVQMVSATLRSYMDGRNTMAARRRSVRDYINSVPLGAIPGAGEIRGIGHGLVAWHGADFAQVNQLLADVKDLNGLSDETIRSKALAYKEVLSLFLSQRRPAFYLQQDQDELKELTNRHVALLAKAGVITPKFAAYVQKAPLGFRNNRAMFQPERQSFIERKAANAVRVHLLGAFGFKRLYTLDRLDLKVTSTIDYDAQKGVASILAKLRDPAFAQANGLADYRLLDKGDPSKIVYSFALRERIGNVNALRVQADNVDGPFNVSEGGKLELGSTAKFRTAVSYLEVVEKLWKSYNGMAPEQLAKVKPHPSDHLTRWALQYLQTAKDRTLKPMLEAAMDRKYSANPSETFFTGGGVHRFVNFEHKEDGQAYDVRGAIHESINLAFVRIIRDVANYYTAQIPGSLAMLTDVKDPRRRGYLTRFANKEGREFLSQFYGRYRGKKGEELVKTLLARVHLTLKRLGAIYSVVHPEGDEHQRERLDHQRHQEKRLGHRQVVHQQKLKCDDDDQLRQCITERDKALVPGGRTRDARFD